MEHSDLDVVTGAFGFSGRHIARLLLGRGRRVRTLTGHPERAGALGGSVAAAPLDFAAPDRLTQGLQGADTLYNTYWIRFPHGDMSFERALQNTRTLLAAAREAGVRRVVHLSVTNPSEASHIPYYQFKARAEQAVREAGMSWAILRPTIIFGPDDVLVNNLAWALRRVPVFAVPGNGEFRLQPVHVEDVAELAVRAGGEAANVTWDAAGPDVFTFNEFLQTVARAVRSRARLVHLPPALSLVASRFIGALLRDVMLTRDELDAMVDELLVSDAPPAGTRSLARWLAEAGDEVGRRYVSDLARHFR